MICYLYHDKYQMYFNFLIEIVPFIKKKVAIVNFFNLFV